jgi:hypothetical protein
VFTASSGVLGFRPSPNPEFNDEARRQWDGNRFKMTRITARTNSASLPSARHLRACHIAPHPDNPPPIREIRAGKFALGDRQHHIREGKVFA